MIYDNEKENIENAKIIYINQKSLEQQKIYRNDLLLQQIADKQYFTDKDSLLNYLNSNNLLIKDNNYQKKIKVDFVQFNQYWLFLLLLLIIEWIIRKRVGLI